MPDGVLFDSSNAHKTLRQFLVWGQKLDAVKVKAEGRMTNGEWKTVALDEVATIQRSAIQPGALAGFEIHLPPLAEQRRVAEVLDRAAA